MMSLNMFKGEPLSIFPKLKCSPRRVVKLGVIDKKNIKKVFLNQDIYKIDTDLSKLRFKQANQRLIIFVLKGYSLFASIPVWDNLFNSIPKPGCVKCTLIKIQINKIAFNKYTCFGTQIFKDTPLSKYLGTWQLFISQMINVVYPSPYSLLT